MSLGDEFKSEAIKIENHESEFHSECYRPSLSPFNSARIKRKNQRNILEYEIWATQVIDDKLIKKLLKSCRHFNQQAKHIAKTCQKKNEN